MYIGMEDRLRPKRIALSWGAVKSNFLELKMAGIDSGADRGAGRDSRRPGHHARFAARAGAVAVPAAAVVPVDG